MGSRSISFGAGVAALSVDTVAPTSEAPSKQARFPARNVATRGHRQDIQGLRAILMIQVLLFHAWTIGSPIGIDAFILVSAYLMTASFVRRSEEGRMPFFLERWANTFKRLLPPLVVVVLTTLGASFLILPMTRWRELVTQAFASVTYWENWRLVEVSADYYANDHALSSPFQHLWSMSMQGQVFLLWPLIMTLCVLVARRLKKNLRGTVLVAFGLVAVASLIWLLFYSPDDGSVYFDTRSRIWEFAFGSAVAAAAPWIKVPQRWARALSVTGLLVLLLFCLVSIGSYPGLMALVPMASVSAILLFAPTAAGGGVTKALSLTPLPQLGDISYSVYLVHWPIFVLYLAYTGKSQLELWDGLMAITASLVVAWALSRLVDEPIRRWRWANRTPWHKATVVFVSLVLALVPIASIWGELQRAAAKEMVEAEPVEIGVESGEEGGVESIVPLSGPGSDAHPGARVLFEEWHGVFTEDPIPGPLVGDSGWGDLGESCREWVVDNVPVGASGSCSSFGNPATASARVLIAGNSHAQQLLTPMVEPLLAKNGWAGDAIFRRCMYTDPDYLEGECVQIVEAINEYVDLIEPEYVFLMVTRTTESSNEEYLVPGIESLVEDLTAKGITVIGLRDNPRSTESLRDCATERDPFAPYDGCLLPREEFLADDTILDGLRAIDGLHVIDMTDALCTDDVCPTMIGNIFVYMDSNHVDLSYASTMAPYFIEKVEEALGVDSHPEGG